jgi:hypothetical protein
MENNMSEIKLVACANGHRNTMPAEALETEAGSTYTCPVCGLGVTRHNFKTTEEKTDPVAPSASHRKYRPLWMGD